LFAGSTPCQGWVFESPALGASGDYVGATVAKCQSPANKGGLGASLGKHGSQIECAMDDDQDDE